MNRILEQWDALLLNFISCTLEDAGLKNKARNLATSLENPINKVYFLFLSYSLKIINKMNTEFQSEQIRIHYSLYDIMESCYKLILTNFIKLESLKYIDCVSEIDIHNRAIYLPIN